MTFYKSIDLEFRGGNPTFQRSFLRNNKAEALKPILLPIVKKRENGVKLHRGVFLIKSSTH